jgi:succinate dehydrogenase / fumarate reductase cytochrome b subunit
MTSKCSCSFINSVTKKQIMGVTGLLLCGFLVSHMIGNYTLLIGPDMFNHYSYALTSNPLIYVAEAGLLGLFLVHIVLAVKLVIENRRARPIPYAHARKASGRGATFASSTMPLTGIIALVFLVIHILGLKFGTHYDTTVDGIEMRDLYRTTIEHFASPLNVIIYLIAVISLGIHTSHGFWSAFQSIGFNHPKYYLKLRKFSYAFGIFIAVGFAILPIFCYFKGGY